MKFFEASLSLLAILPAVVSAASIQPAYARRQFDDDRHSRGGNGGFGNFPGNNNKGGQGGQGQGGHQTSSSVAVATSSVATASSVASNNAAAASSTAAASSGNENSQDAQSSLTLDPRVISTGFEQDGQANATAGQVPSATSSNNFINFCLTINKPLTNGQQIPGGSCDTAPMGQIASSANMPSSKFAFPANGQTIQSNTPFTVVMNILHLETGHFVNADTNFFAAPQVCNEAGDIEGHSHMVIEKLDSLNQTTPTNPGTFAFFKGLNDVAVNGQLSAEVTAGLPAGAYRVASINSAANHQPALVAIAQHGALDDMSYFLVSDNAADVTGANGQAATAAGATATAAGATATSAKATSTAAAGNTGSSKNQGKTGNNGNAGNQNQNAGNQNQNKGAQQQGGKNNRRQLNRISFN